MRNPIFVIRPTRSRIFKVKQTAIDHICCGGAYPLYSFYAYVFRPDAGEGDSRYYTTGFRIFRTKEKL